MTKHLKTVNLYGVAMLLLMTACSPKVVTHISKVYPDIIPTDSVYVIELGDKVPNTAETIGRISVVDRGTSSKCRYDQVLHLAQEATGKNGGNGLAITDHLKPSFWGSSCHQISGLMLRLSDRQVDTMKVNPVQDMIELDHVVTKERAENRRAPSSTFEGSIGYGWVTSKLYDVDGPLFGKQRRCRLETLLRIHLEQWLGDRNAIFRFQSLFPRRKHDVVLHCPRMGGTFQMG